MQVTWKMTGTRKKEQIVHLPTVSSAKRLVHLPTGSSGQWLVHLPTVSWVTSLWIIFHVTYIVCWTLGHVTNDPKTRTRRPSRKWTNNFCFRKWAYTTGAYQCAATRKWTNHSLRGLVRLLLSRPTCKDSFKMNELFTNDTSLPARQYEIPGSANS